MRWRIFYLTAESDGTATSRQVLRPACRIKSPPLSPSRFPPPPLQPKPPSAFSQRQNVMMVNRDKGTCQYRKMPLSRLSERIDTGISPYSQTRAAVPMAPDSTRCVCRLPQVPCIMLRLFNVLTFFRWFEAELGSDGYPPRMGMSRGCSD